MLHRLKGRATWLVSRAHIRAHALLHEAFAAAGSRPYHYRVLAALAEHGPMSQAETARRAEMDRSDVTASLDTLCAAGLTARAPDPTDRRRNVVSLTPAGTAELHRLDTVLDGVQHRVLAPLTAEEQEQLLTLLTRLGEPGSD